MSMSAPLTGHKRWRSTRTVRSWVPALALVLAACTNWQVGDYTLFGFDPDDEAAVADASGSMSIDEDLMGSLDVSWSVTDPAGEYTFSCTFTSTEEEQENFTPTCTGEYTEGGTSEGPVAIEGTAFINTTNDGDTTNFHFEASDDAGAAYSGFYRFNKN